MKWILTFIGGTLLGVLALFIYLRKVGTEAPPPVVVPPAVSAPAAPATPAPAAALPGAAELPAELADAELPVRPPATVPVLERVDGVLAAGAAGPGGKLMIPVQGIKLSDLSDSYDQKRGTDRTHEALDIMAPKGTKVYATADGKVAKLFNSKQGGLTIYQFDPTETYAYYYAHLDRYADGIKEGDVLKRGDLVGYVGVTGNSDSNGPHLHFAVFELTPEKQWWTGTPVNPFPLMDDQAAATAAAPAPTR